jgi:predicted transcriptional regulator YdeE
VWILDSEYRIAAARLIDVERRLHLIERENQMSRIEIIEKPLPAVRLAALRLVVSDQPAVAGVVGPAFDAVAAVIGNERGALETPIAQYEMRDDTLHIVVGYAYRGPAREGIEIVELPGSELAVCGIHLGPMDHISESWQALHAEIIDRGLVHAGPCRELYVRAVSDDQADWVTELQQPVARN